MPIARAALGWYSFTFPLLGLACSSVTRTPLARGASGEGPAEPSAAERYAAAHRKLAPTDEGYQRALAASLDSANPYERNLTLKVLDRWPRLLQGDLLPAIARRLDEHARIYDEGCLRPLLQDERGGRERKIQGSTYPRSRREVELMACRLLGWSTNGELAATLLKGRNFPDAPAGQVARPLDRDPITQCPTAAERVAAIERASELHAAAQQAIARRDSAYQEALIPSLESAEPYERRLALEALRTVGRPLPGPVVPVVVRRLVEIQPLPAEACAPNPARCTDEQKGSSGALAFELLGPRRDIWDYVAAHPASLQAVLTSLGTDPDLGAEDVVAAVPSARNAEGQVALLRHALTVNFARDCEPDALLPLLPLYESPDATVRRLVPLVVLHLTKNNVDPHALAPVRDPAIAALGARLRDASDARIAQDLLVLGSASRPLVPALCGRLERSANLEERRMLVRVLGRIDIGSADAVPLLVRMLREPANRPLRGDVLETLASLGLPCPGMKEALLETAESDPSSVTGVLAAVSAASIKLSPAERSRLPPHAGPPAERPSVAQGQPASPSTGPGSDGKRERARLAEFAWVEPCKRSLHDLAQKIAPACPAAAVSMDERLDAPQEAAAFSRKAGCGLNIGVDLSGHSGRSDWRRTESEIFPGGESVERSRFGLALAVTARGSAKTRAALLGIGKAMAEACAAAADDGYQEYRLTVEQEDRQGECIRPTGPIQPHLVFHAQTGALTYGTRSFLLHAESGRWTAKEDRTLEGPLFGCGPAKDCVEVFGEREIRWDLAFGEGTVAVDLAVSDVPSELGYTRPICEVHLKLRGELVPQ